MVPAQVASAGATEGEWLRPSTDKAPRLQVQRTEFGFRYVAIRRPIERADTHDYLRITLFVAPFTVLIPPNDRYQLSILNIPLDDTNTMFYFIAWSESKGIEQQAWREFCKARVGVDLDADFRRIRTLENNYLQDRDAMKHGSHTGIAGIPNQDIAMWETMGPIADRSRERLGASDMAIGNSAASWSMRRAGSRRRSGNRHFAATYRPRQAQVLRGHRAEKPTDDARRRGGGASSVANVVVAARREAIRAMAASD
jgi:phthalate 4,5-dioxygenase oxygenase subunit